MTKNARKQRQTKIEQSSPKPADSAVIIQNTDAILDRHNNKLKRLILILSITVCMTISIGARYNFYLKTQQIPIYQYTPSTAIMSTTDAYYWLRMAREYKEDTYKAGEKDTLRDYPEHGPLVPKKVPLLSLLIAWTSYLFNGNIYESAFYLIPFLSSLFIIPLCIYFFKIGYPAVGIAASIMGALSPIYLVRTGVGRVDTDCLIMFFLFLASLFILTASSKNKKTASTITFSALAGLTMYFYYQWYFFPIITIVFFLILIATLKINKTGCKRIILSAAAFIIFSNPLYFAEGFTQAAPVFTRYIADYLHIKRADQVLKTKPKEQTKDEQTKDEQTKDEQTKDEQIKDKKEDETPPKSSQSAKVSSDENIDKYKGKLPDVYISIQEAQRESLSKILQLISGNAAVSLIGIALFTVFTFYKWRELLPLGYVLIMGGASFFSASRFSMYLAPFIGAGFGYLATAAVNYLLRKLKDGSRKSLIVKISAVAASILISLALSYKPAVSAGSLPIFTNDTYKSLQKIKDILPKDSLIFTWWDKGYAVTDITGFATLHDGGIHETTKTYFIAQSLTSSSPVFSYNILGIMQTEGHSFGIARVNEARQENHFVIPRNNNSYLLFTFDMVNYFSGIYYYASWDFDRKSGVTDAAYSPLFCIPINSETFNCQNFMIDLKNGLINNRAALTKAVLIKDGSIVKEYSYDVQNAMYLEILIKDDKLLAAYLINEKLYKTTFNQMYILGKYDDKLYTQVYNDYPFVRVFKIRNDVERGN
ncbi:oligosaccharyl transferase STT3 subunit [Candidatus Magnetoovum chiemensis]|nr:oligosaccharyl transferase STT3 subunit [Candidatus Magnetoovum chiemensis]